MEDKLPLFAVIDCPHVPNDVTASTAKMRPRQIAFSARKTTSAIID